MTPYVTRIAPSPTGMMHIGTARTALFNWLAAKASGGRFILRIDDTDVERNNEAAVQPIIDGLSWLGLDYDETFRQSDKARQASYREIGESLLNAGEATRASNGAIILSWNAANARSWRDNIGGEITITDTNVEQIHERTVLTRGDDKLGAPTYQFSSIVDDCLSGVNYIIRGTDHITNTSKQLAIKWAIERVYGKEYPMEFAHVGLIFKDKKKMSKRDGAASLLDYRDRGYNPDALFNFLLRMGWAPSEDNKTNSIMARSRAIEAFLSEGRMRNVNANFDEQKLNWYQRVFSRG